MGASSRKLVSDKRQDGPKISPILRGVKRLLFWATVAVAGVLALIVAALLLWLLVILFAHHRLNSKVENPSNYRPAVLQAVKLCQSNPAWFIHHLDDDPLWAPTEIASLDPSSVNVYPDHAQIFFGGGFYHCELTIKRKGDGEDPSGKSQWVVRFTSEGGADDLLETIEVDNAIRCDEKTFVTQALKQYDQFIALYPQETVYAQEKASFLAEHPGFSPSATTQPSVN